MLTSLHWLLRLILVMICLFAAVLLVGLLVLNAVLSIWQWNWERRLWSKRTEEEYERSWGLEPKNPKWPAKLGHLWILRMSRSTGEARTAAAEKAFRYYREWLAPAHTTRIESDYSDLQHLAITALEAGAEAEARIYAERLLEIAARHAREGYGNSLHYGHTILGRLALRSGDIQQAREHLLKAGETPGSPQLDSFGPGMILAKELLERGEREVVLQYFALCARFWKMGRRKLGRWSRQVRSGRIPDFKGHLNR